MACTWFPDRQRPALAKRRRRTVRRFRRRYARCGRNENTASHSMATILLVDDNYENLWALHVALQGMGHHVLLAQDGKTGFAMALRHLPDLVISDCDMPGTSGPELCTRLKCTPALSHIPVFLMSGESQPDSTDFPCEAFLTKPVRPDELEHIASRFIAARIALCSQVRSWPPLRASRWPAIDARCWP